MPCRSTKSRCNGERPTCGACRVRSRDCVYPDGKRRKLHAETESQRAQSAQSSPRLQPVAHHNPQSQSSPAYVAQSDTRGVSSANPQPPPVYNVLALAPETDAQSFTTSSLIPTRPASSGPFDAPTSVMAGSVSNGSFDGRPEQLGMPTVREQLHMINDFFRHLHPLPAASFLSEVSVTKRCLDGSIDPALLLALCGLTSSILKYPKYYPHQSTRWVERSENLAWENIEHPTLFRTQALLLSVLCRVETGNFKRGYMLQSMASRCASALRLQYERVDLDHLSLEVRRRLMWSIMLIDSYFSVGLPESGTCQPDFIYLKMPCAEEEFQAEPSSLISQALDGVSECGLLQRYLRLSIIRRDVMRLKRHLSLQTHPTPQITPLVEEMLRSLREANITAYSFQELQKYARSRWYVRYVAVQIATHQSYCDIYRLFLAGYREAAPVAAIEACSPDYVAHAALACLGHARTVVEIIADVRKLDLNMISAPRDICIGGYHASRLLLFLSNSSIIPREQNISTSDATMTARSMLEVLTQWFSSHVMLSRTVKDLSHIVQTHVPGAPSQDRESSEEQVDSGTRSQPRFAMTIQRHTSLGIHSALRYARFRDDDDDDMLDAENAVDGAGSTSGPWSDPKLSPGVLLRELVQPDLTTTLVPREPSDSFPPLEFPDPMVPAAWDLDTWTAWGWQNDFSPGSTHDCI